MKPKPASFRAANHAEATLLSTVVPLFFSVPPLVSPVINVAIVPMQLQRLASGLGLGDAASTRTISRLIGEARSCYLSLACGRIRLNGPRI